MLAVFDTVVLMSGGDDTVSFHADDADDEMDVRRDDVRAPWPTKRYGCSRVPFAIWRWGWRRWSSAAPVSNRPCPSWAPGTCGAPGGGMTMTASASSKEDGTRVNFEFDLEGEVGLGLSPSELVAEGVGEGVREVDEDDDVDTRRLLYSQECCGTWRRGHD